jgi:hydroxymethylpyrimidine pyrophosphatase-like HAD family hydrolase
LAPPADLLVDLAGLSRLLGVELDRGPGLDAFLYAAGINQILEDHLHRDWVALRRVRPRLRALPSTAGAASDAVAAAALGLGLAGRRANWRERRVVSTQRLVSELVAGLAAALVRAPALNGRGERRDGEAGPGEPRQELGELGGRVLKDLERLPSRLRRELVRPPTSFRSLDQQPADLSTIVDSFSRHHPDRGQSLLVVGVRTSGSYLAPLYRASLDEQGYRDVRMMTIRPEDDLLVSEVRQVQALVRDGGLLLVADDPPKTGAALAACLERFEAMGVARAAIVLLLPLLTGADSLAPALAAYSSITLPRTEWAIERRLSEESLRGDLHELLSGRTVELSPPAPDRERLTVDAVLSARRLPLPAVTGFQVGSDLRRHVRALVRLRLREAGGGDGGGEFDHHVYVKGVGLGYFGDHSRALADALPEFLPELYGIRGGLLFRRWMDDRSRIEQPGPEELDQVADRIADYVHARHRRLAVEEDRAPRRAGVPQEVVKLMAGCFGRLALPARSLLHPWARRLLRVEEPSVIDGSMSLRQWFRAGATGLAEGLVKVDYDERAFSNQDTVVDELYSYDAVFDLAGAAVDFSIGSGEPSLEARFEDRLRCAYEARAGHSVPAARWLLYQLVLATTQIDFLQEALAVQRGRSADPAGLRPAADEVAAAADRGRRAMARFEQRYLARLFLNDIAETADGPLCALDIDGVLETVTIGYSSSTPLGVLSLRALLRHGYRPVLATGRSLDEVRDRCFAYGLEGGVAEYGAVAYDHRRDRVIELLTEEQRRKLDGLRAALRQIENVQIDDGHQRAVRASTGDPGGRRRHLPARLADEVVAAQDLTGDVRVVHGDAQTDFVVKGVDKGRGLRVLLDALGGTGAGGEAKPLALAVGDTESDLPMLAQARMTAAPANADQSLRDAGVPIMVGDCQQGLARAVGKLVGHAPGGCPLCAAGHLDRESKLLLAVLSAQSEVRWGKLRPAARLVPLLVR